MYWICMRPVSCRCRRMLCVLCNVSRVTSSLKKPFCSSCWKYVSILYTWNRHFKKNFFFAIWSSVKSFSSLVCICCIPHFCTPVRNFALHTSPYGIIMHRLSFSYLVLTRGHSRRAERCWMELNLTCGRSSYCLSSSQWDIVDISTSSCFSSERIFFLYTSLYMYKGSCLRGKQKKRKKGQQNAGWSKFMIPITFHWIFYISSEWRPFWCVSFPGSFYFPSLLLFQVSFDQIRNPQIVLMLKKMARHFSRIFASFLKYFQIYRCNQAFQN